GKPEVRTIFIDDPFPFYVSQAPLMHILQFFAEYFLGFSFSFSTNRTSIRNETVLVSTFNTTFLTPFSAFNELPKIYNFRYKLEKRDGDSLVSVYIFESACFAITFRDYRFFTSSEVQDGIFYRFRVQNCSSNGSVSLLTYNAPDDTFTFNFDPNNSDNITAINSNVIFLKPNPTAFPYSATEILLSCIFGINV
ncbi:35167_t:CDS:2, partial [Racocetra persica]